MLDFEHFATEYGKLAILLGVPIDQDRVELYYRQVQDFSDSMLTECFEEAGGSFRKMPLPVDLKEIRSIISQRHFERQPKLAPSAEVYGPMPDHIREFMQNISRFPTGKTEPKAQKRTLTLEEIRNLEKGLSYGEGEDF